MLSMTALEKSIDIMVKKLVKIGFNCEVEVFNDPTKGGFYGGSGITVTISHEDYSSTVEFKPKYGFNTDKCIAGFDKWSLFKTRFKSLIKKDLPSVDVSSI